MIKNQKDIVKYNSNNLDNQLFCQKTKHSTLSIKQKNLPEIFLFFKISKTNTI